MVKLGSNYSLQVAKHATLNRVRSLFTTAVALSAMALFVKHQATQVEQEHPPRGKFIEVDGVRLRYIEEGAGDPLVLIHGNGTMAEDYQISTVFGRAAKTHRVIAFDRPGYGYSARPDIKQWDATAQAQLLHKALVQLGVERPVVLGHSWGTLVALSMALEEPHYVRALVLLSGYYYPMPRIDVVLSAPMAIPLFGRLIRNTISPIIGRIAWPLAVRKLFIPSSQPSHFRRHFPVWMTMRPSQLLASARDAAMMIPEASRLKGRYHELHMPIILMAGAGDLLALPKLHSERLHNEIGHSKLVLTAGVGHMIHQVVPQEVMKVIEMAFAPDITALTDNELNSITKVA